MSFPFDDPTPLIDRDRIAALDLPADEWNDLVQLYRDSAAEAVRDMRAAVERDDARRLSALAHKLKGTSANLGFTAMAAFCAKLERPGLLATTVEPAIWERVLRMIEETVEEARHS